MKTKDLLIHDFMNPMFQEAFMQYITELGITVRDWDKLFSEMTNEGNNLAYLRLKEDGTVVGFIQFQLTSLSNWFFDIPAGFVREFWISKDYRGMGHGSEMLHLAEAYFTCKGAYKSILTTDTAETFYLQHEYIKDTNIHAKNKDDVFIKNLH